MAKVDAERLHVPTLNGFPPSNVFSRFLAFQFENVSSHQARHEADDEALFLLLILLSSQWSACLPYLSTRPPEAFCHRSEGGKKSEQLVHRRRRSPPHFLLGFVHILNGKMCSTRFPSTWQHNGQQTEEKGRGRDPRKGYCSASPVPTRNKNRLVQRPAAAA